MENELGEWVKEENQIGELLIRFYSNLFTLSNPTNLDPVLNGVQPRVFRSMNDDLLRLFEASEVQRALEQMKSDTALGLDGFPPLFFK